MCAGCNYCENECKSSQTANSSVCIANVNTIIRHLRKQHVKVIRKAINKGCADALKLVEVVKIRWLMLT